MTIEKTKATDVVSSGLTCNTKAGETAQATGVYHVECHDKDGNLKHNIVKRDYISAVLKKDIIIILAKIKNSQKY